MIDLKPACEQMIKVLDGVSDGQLTVSSPCALWSVGDVIDHVNQVALVFTALAFHDTDALLGVATNPDAAHLDSHWQESISRHLRTLGESWDDPAAWKGSGNVPGSDLSNDRWGKITLTELVVHCWDIARATGQPFDLPESSLRACFEHVAEFVPNAPVPALWGPPVDIASDEALLDRIVAITGRRP
jgi:uncharacterized protein (TIGR03086 family)